MEGAPQPPEAEPTLERVRIIESPLTPEDAAALYQASIFHWPELPPTVVSRDESSGRIVSHRLRVPGDYDVETVRGMITAAFDTVLDWLSAELAAVPKPTATDDEGETARKKYWLAEKQKSIALVKSWQTRVTTDGDGGIFTALYGQLTS